MAAHADAVVTSAIRRKAPAKYTNEKNEKGTASAQPPGGRSCRIRLSGLVDVVREGAFTTATALRGKKEEREWEKVSNEREREKQTQAKTLKESKGDVLTEDSQLLMQWEEKWKGKRKEDVDQTKHKQANRKKNFKNRVHQKAARQTNKSKMNLFFGSATPTTFD